ncbi:DNA polymerase zeta, partial [Linderina pennispora]
MQRQSVPPSLPVEAQSVLDVQITSISPHMAAPTPADCVLKTPYNIFSEPLRQVPVIRIFGSTKTRQRICLHVHQAWPYMYIRYDGPSSLDSVREFGYQLGLSLNHALNISFKSAKPQIYVAAVIPVKGVPFYGYHAGYRPFLKILLSNPGVMSRASMLLASGAVMNQKFDLFESHLPYTLQFLVDYNLFGMDWVNLANVRYRSPLPVTEDTEMISDATVGEAQRWVPGGMPLYLVNPQPPPRISRCELEADAVAADIINRQHVPERHVHHVFKEGQLGMHCGKLVHSLSQVWADENQRRAVHGMKMQQQHDSQVLERRKDAPQVEAAAQRSRPGLEWSNHWRMQSLLQSALANDRQHVDRGVSGESLAMWEDVSQKLSDIGSELAQDSSSMYISNTAEGSNSWVDSWPTCREVDAGE